MKKKNRTIIPEKKVTKKDIVKMLLNQDLVEQDEEDLLELLIDKPISIDVDKQEEINKTFGDRMADKISAVAGSWIFILGFACFIAFWIVINTAILLNGGPDPYPFILLNLLLSCLAAFQAPIIMMSQNRQARKDSLRNMNDYHTDLKSELILEELHEEICKLNKNQNKILKILAGEDENN